MKLKLYSSKKWLASDSTYHFILYPFWGIDRKYEKNEQNKRFEKFINNAHQYFEFTDEPDDTQYIVYPIDYGNVRKNNSSFDIAQRLAKTLNKKLIVFYFSDFDEPLILDNCIVFRNSLDSRTRKPYEFAAPAMVEDFAKHLDIDYHESKKERPKIGFCGYIDFETPQEWFMTMPHRFKNLLKDTFFKRHFFEAEAIRGRAIRVLQKNASIDLQFIKRRGYWGKWATKSNVIKDTFQEYVQTIENTDYHLVARGNGNFSIRFSEILSSGRLPVFIDTHCVLPFENIIDWKKELVWVDEKDLNKIDKILFDFHNNISEEEFKDRKKRMKYLFNEYISPDGFFKNMYQVLLEHSSL
jgi:hypothetical protein